MRDIKPKTDSYAEPSLGSLKKVKARPVYPTFRIDLEHLPEAKNWKLNKEYTIEMKLKLVGLSQSRFDNSAEFEILAIEPDDAMVEGEDDSETE